MIFVSSNSISLQTLNVHSYKMFAKGKQTSTSVCSLYLKSFQVHSAQFLLLKKCAKKFGSNSRSSREEFLIKREASVEKKESENRNFRKNSTIKRQKPTKILSHNRKYIYGSFEFESEITIYWPIPQCGNSRIYLPLRFYVKSMLGNMKPHCRKLISRKI